ncbi:MAG: proline dehydrogenase family protein [Bacteroidetes bacterium]|nr:proline dehydrogenase family protein [Bacteroidota bacterium]MBX7239167.1 proline dehydrogenase family protein [Bacteroidia bacterium]MCC7513648.1 proline dehydrogenase family protein [Bacteroidia bacterium]MCW5919871.1 proline dehydrogenase family protein [Bacteroidota bacterium]HCI57649.1 proline dehydrogenase [Bacteroidota bacterium]
MPSVSFNNLKVAFAYKSDADLKRAYWLFRLININFLVKIGPGFTNAVLKMGLPIKPLIRATIYKHFCGGETIEQCTETINNLGKYGVGSILDYSVEGHHNESDFDHSCAEIIKTVKHASGKKNIPFSVFKVTGVGRMDLLERVSSKVLLTGAEDAEFQRLKARVESICKTAAENNVRLFIDAEETWIQDAIDQMVDDMMLKYNKEKTLIFNTVQLYRHDRVAFMKENIAKARSGNYKIGYKLVRGAYMEKERERAALNGYPSPIQPDKAACDKDYNEAIKLCIENIDMVAVCAGTHNEESSALLAKLMEEKGIANSDERIWFSQLLGMSDHISFNLANAGYCVCKYVPYGPVVSVLPYLFRRAAENTSMSGQMGRELSMITQEIERRKKEK